MKRGLSPTLHAKEPKVIVRHEPPKAARYDAWAKVLFTGYLDSFVVIRTLSLVCKSFRALGMEYVRKLDLHSTRYPHELVVHVVLPRYPRVARLSLEWTHITDNTLASITSGLPHLTHLNLHGCKRITNHACRSIALLEHLKHLDLSYCDFIGDAALHYLQTLKLHSLKLSMCPNVTDASMPYLGQINTLSELDLSCTNVTSSGFMQLASNFHQFESIELSGCRIDDYCAKALFQSAPKLTQIGLAHCELLTPLFWDHIKSIPLSNLRILILRGARPLLSVFTDTITTRSLGQNTRQLALFFARQCPHLQYLDITSCDANPDIKKRLHEIMPHLAVDDGTTEYPIGCVCTHENQESTPATTHLSRMSGVNSSQTTSGTTGNTSPTRMNEGNRTTFGFPARTSAFGARGRGRSSSGRNSNRAWSPTHGQYTKSSSRHRNSSHVPYKARTVGRSRSRSKERNSDRRGDSRDRSRERYHDRSRDRDRRRDSFPKDNPLDSQSSPEKTDRLYDSPDGSKKNSDASAEEEGLVKEESPLRTPVRRPSFGSANSPVVKYTSSPSTRHRDSPQRHKENLEKSRRRSIEHLVLKRSESMSAAMPPARRPSLDLKRAGSITLPVVASDEALIEPPRPTPSANPEPVDSTPTSEKQAENHVKRPRLGWGQGLVAASSPTPTAQATKRPRVSWGQGLMSQQTPPAQEPEPQPLKPEGTASPPPPPENDVKDQSVAEQKSLIPEEQPTPIPPVQFMQPIQPLQPFQPAPTPQNAMTPLAQTSEPILTIAPRKEDILESIDRLDADISRVQNQLTSTRDEYEALKIDPVSLFEEPPEEQTVVELKKKVRPILVDPELMATVSSMMSANQAKAETAASNVIVLGTPSVTYLQPSEAPGIANIIASCEKLRPRILARIMARKKQHYAKMRDLAVEFVQLKKVWRQKVKRIEKDKKKQEKLRTKLLKQQKKPQPTTPSDGSTAVQDDATNSVRTSSRLTNNSNSQPLLPNLQSGLEKDGQAQWEQENRRKKLKGAMVGSGSSNSPYVIPDMLLDEDQLQVQRFIRLPRPYLTGMEKEEFVTQTDGLLEYAVEKKTNPWSDLEKCIYADKFLQFPKQFYQIGTYLKNKTTGDVIAFYYNTKKVVDYKAIIREQQLRRRGSGIKGTWNCWHLSICVAMALGVQFPDNIKNLMLQKTNFRSHQASNCILQAVQGVKEATDDNSSTNDEDKEARDTVPPMFLDLTTFLTDNTYTTGFEPTSVSVYERFRKFLASPQYQPEPPPSALESEPIKVAKLKIRKDKDIPDAMPSPASRRKSGTPRSINLPKKDVKKNTKPKKDEANPLPKKKVSPTNVQDDLSTINQTPQPIQEPTSSSPMNEKKQYLKPPPPPMLQPPPVVNQQPQPLLSKHPMMQLNVPLHVPVLHTPSPSGAIHHPSLLPTPIGQPAVHNPTNLPPGKRVVQKWTEQEKSDFLKYFQVYGKDWSALTNSIPTKTAAQIKNYYQNYKNRLGLQDILKKRTERITSTGSDPNTPQSGPVIPTASSPPTDHVKSPQGPTAPAGINFPAMPSLQPSISQQPQSQAPNDYPFVSMNARHKLMQLQCELSRITMQQPPETPAPSGTSATSMAYSTLNSQASQMKLLQYSLQQQVQMLQMQIHQQELNSNPSYQGPSLPPRMTQLPERLPIRTNDYYDNAYSDSNKPYISNDQPPTQPQQPQQAPQHQPQPQPQPNPPQQSQSISLMPRPHLDGEQRSTTLPPLTEAPTITIPQSSSRSLMSFSSILNESSGSPYSVQTPPASTPVAINRNSVPNLLNRHHIQTSGDTPPPPQPKPSSSMNLHLNPSTLRPQQYYNSPSLHGLHPTRNLYPSLSEPSSDIRYNNQVPQTFQQQLQQRQMQQNHYNMENASQQSEAEVAWSIEQQRRYEEEAQSLHRRALEKEAVARRAEEEAARAAAAAAAAARALQEAQAARQAANNAVRFSRPPFMPPYLPPPQQFSSISSIQNDNEHPPPSSSP
ncbi:hypothetical protein THRCLA_03815 [Thraustotheca clavata]|uniref:SANT domain-containing protein n=1 Tax=Thraustotheca clavata TaxID=74557 RepID=A0A1W0A0U6_9STRA|nr:hypothetical protein THRCLA_03815 [Thraustotheca clavata]